MSVADPPNTPKIFAAYPATDERRLIQRWGHRNDSRLSYEFAESAKRLAATHVGQPVDDMILLPLLYLYRHAIELTLKESIHRAAWLRRRSGEDDPRLDLQAVSDRLRSKHRHSIGALVNELNEHMQALELQTIPKGTAKFLQMLAEVDATGEAFRYTGWLPESQDNIDFPSLSADLAETFEITAAAQDVLEAFGDAQAEWLAARAEIEAEMRADYESDLAAETGRW